MEQEVYNNADEEEPQTQELDLEEELSMGQNLSLNWWMVMITAPNHYSWLRDNQQGYCSTRKSAWPQRRPRLCMNAWKGIK